MMLFSYGTLTLPEIRDRILGHAVETRDAVLPGYSKVCCWDYFTVVPSEGSVRGIVFEASVEDVRRMDLWEDVPTYALEPVTILCEGNEIDAYAYIMPQPPGNYEQASEDAVAAIPIRDIMADLERLMGPNHRQQR